MARCSAVIVVTLRLQGTPDRQKRVMIIIDGNNSNSSTDISVDSRDNTDNSEL